MSIVSGSVTERGILFVAVGPTIWVMVPGEALTALGLPFTGRQVTKSGSGARCYCRTADMAYDRRCLPDIVDKIRTFLKSH